MVLCAAFGCGNRTSRSKAAQETGLSYFRFPKDPERRDAWIKATRLQNWTPNKRSVLCSKHFEDHFIDRSSLFSVRLEKNAVPTIFPGFPAHLQKKMPSRKPPKSRILPAIRSATSVESSAPVVESSAPVVESSIPPVDNVIPAVDRIGVSSLVSPPVEHVFNLPQHTSSENVATPLNPFILDTPRKVMLRKTIHNMKKSFTTKLKRLQQKTRRHTKKIAHLKDVIASLHKFLPEENIDNLRNIGGKNEEFLQRHIAKRTGNKCPNKYGADIRTFALTLHFYSPKAYSFVRRQFDSCLPHPKTISKWYQCLDGEPGFSTEAFLSIKKRVDQNTRKLRCALVFDEMAIRRLIEYDGKKYYGHVDMGTGLESEEEAREVLVFMIVCINGSWKIPVGYFLINGVSGEEKSSLVNQCLTLAHEAGVCVTSVTFDGASANFSMAKHLGCELKISNLKPFFEHPVTKDTVYIFPDPSHMLKLIRNTFADKKIIVNESNNLIEWKYIEKLYDLQESEGLHLGNKLKSSHIRFRKQIMKVKLAAQLFSMSVADALLFCKDALKLNDFSDCQPTIEFIIMINNIFDCLNSRSLRSLGFKKAVNSNNIDDIVKLANEAKHFLINLKCNRTCDDLIIDSNRKTGFIGFIICLETITLLSKQLLTCSDHLVYLPTYKLSQDHLELFFGSIRSHGGCNNNPSARQFKTALKKCIVHTDLKDTSSGNCIPLEDIKILHFSSKPEILINASSARSTLIPEEENSGDDLESIINDHSYIVDNSLSECTNNIVAYIGGFVVRHLHKSIICEECLDVLSVSDPVNVSSWESPYSLINIKSNGGLIYPSSDVIKICQIAERTIRQRFSESGSKCMPKKYTTDVLLSIVMMALRDINLFDNLSQHIIEQSPLDNHIGLLIRAIARKYIDIRLHYIAKRYVDSSLSVRNSFNKLVLFKGF